MSSILQNLLTKSRDIVVKDPKLQRLIHTSLYYILSSIREGQDNSISPLGLSNNWWYGHIFWDAELWVFPALVLLHPELAKSIVMYRHKTRRGAMLNAKKKGYQGAQYPVESADSGLEIAPPPYCYEIHFTGAVPFIQWYYYLVTKDREYLKKYGIKIINKVAMFWASRVKYNRQFDRYEILQVLPPDESVWEVHKHKRINNSVYTNAIAQRNLYIAIEANKLLGKNYPSEWKSIADKMYFPFAKKKQIYLPYEEYKGAIMKLLDVILLNYPLNFPMAEVIKQNNFNYYKNKISESPNMMLLPSLSIVAKELGRIEESWKFFKDMFKYFLPPFGAVSEQPNNNVTIFLTGLGGFLQNLLFGFGGIRIEKNCCFLQPLLPEEIPQLHLKGIHYGNSIFNITITKNKNGDIVNIKKLSGKSKIKIAKNSIQEGPC